VLSKRRKEGIMKVKIDEELCTGCGVCESLCPEVFEIKDDEKAHVKDADCKGCDCQDAADSCPAEAIIIEQD
jgi:ferredoxin